MWGCTRTCRRATTYMPWDYPRRAAHAACFATPALHRKAWLFLALCLAAHQGAAAQTPKVFTAEGIQRLKLVQDVWRQHRSPNTTELQQLRQEAWDMFDFGFSSYMKHAFPKDNLLPRSCAGQDWQGGMALTLIDSLDALLLLNRRGDIEEAVRQLRGAINFNKDIKVHVFETTIRVLGGLLSGHVLLSRDPSLVPEYDNLFLRLATDLADRMLPAFNTRTGLPGNFVHLQRGKIEHNNATCTACAGTLLMEFGLLSKLTGNRTYMDKADAAAKQLYARRSGLGLVGRDMNLDSGAWTSPEATIGPGVDSYYEYLLKAYLMFGDEQYLDMFVDLYMSVMKYLQVHDVVGPAGASFLVDVHMDNGRLVRPWVSSLGAFWPAMQVLAGLVPEARELHSNFTAAWRQFGWLPESFSLDLTTEFRGDPGYNLRPEHIESTFYLAAVTQDPQYVRLAKDMMAVVQASRTRCGYTKVHDVSTAELNDLQESYFLAETVKYLYLVFSPHAGHLLDHWLLSTEAHLMPIFEGPGDERAWAQYAALAKGLGSVEGPHGTSSSSSSGGSGISGSGGREGGERAPQDRSAGAGRACPTPLGSGVWPHCSVPSATSGRAATNTSSSSTSAAGNMAPLLAQQTAHVPVRCQSSCGWVTPEQEQRALHELLSSFPLIGSSVSDARRLRQRRCKACLALSAKLQQAAPPSEVETLSRLAFGVPSAQSASGGGAGQGERVDASAVLAQLVCELEVVNGGVRCGKLARVQAHHAMRGFGPSALVLHLLKVAPPFVGAGVLMSVETEEGPATLLMEAAPSQFGPRGAEVTAGCVDQLLVPTLRVGNQAPCAVPPPPWTDSSSSSSSGEPRIPSDAGQGLPIRVDSSMQMQELDDGSWTVVVTTNMTSVTLHQHSTEVGSHDSSSSSSSGSTRDTEQLHSSFSIPAAGTPGELLSSSSSIGVGAGETTAAAASLPWLPAATPVPPLGWPYYDWVVARSPPGAVWPGLRVGRSSPSAAACTAAEAALAAAVFKELYAAAQLPQLYSLNASASPAAASHHVFAGTWPQQWEAAAAAADWLPPACIGMTVNAWQPPAAHGTRQHQWDTLSVGPGSSWLSPPAAQALSATSKGSCRAAAQLPAGLLVPAQPLHGCSPPSNAAMMQGAVALVVRGSCSFTRKVALMEAAGALGVVVANHEGGREIFMMSRDEGNLVEPAIPAVMVPQEDGRLLQWWAARRPVVVSLVQGVAEGDITALAVGPRGTAAQGQHLARGRAVPVQPGRRRQQQQQQQGKGKGKAAQGNQQRPGAAGDALVPGGASSTGSSSPTRHPATQQQQQQHLRQQRRVRLPYQQRARRWQQQIQVLRARQQQQPQHEQQAALDLSHTRVEISVPLTTQPWLAANIWSKGITSEALYQSLGQQQHLMFALVSEGKRARKQQLLAEKRRQKKL